MLFLSISKEFIAFVNRQKGVYVDACAGFAENKRVVGRQAFRVMKEGGYKSDEPGKQVVLHTWAHDESHPDNVTNHITLASSFTEANSIHGSNSQQVCKSIVVFIFAYWDEEVRPKLARSICVANKQIRSDIMGDIRLLRNDILHNKSVMSEESHRRLTTIAELFVPGQPIVFYHSTMNEIFKKINRGVAYMLRDCIGMQLPPDADKIISLAIRG